MAKLTVPQQPQQHKVVFTGDIVYITRMLGVGSQSNSKSWVKVFEEMAKLNPDVLVPGHGSVTTLKKAQTDSYEYLIDLREKVAEFIDNDGYRHYRLVTIQIFT